ncbi:hypothetical protein SAMN04489724_3781 [Algoriphagus locisalis]|uniref:Uncharacterized protein n=1 Tax=Algoriphagus locisalis TaxID=305507 RepID=A0A1I7D956_9BACT|nr:hypothetical protein [Algoriphagus locisalis]SFU08177.1 hypothetical protein SAMN04489724_3781 [Algoriphagus locisalis]
MSSLLLYYRQISSFNIPFSVAVASLAYSQGGNFGVYFFLTLLTVGYLLALYLYEVRYAQQYFFYYNLGFDKIKLVGFTFGVNAAIALIYFLIF